MENFRGAPVSPGIVIGPAFVLESEGVRIPRQFIMPDEVPAEIERFQEAIAQARDEVQGLQQRISDDSESSASLAGIFKAHVMMLEDTGWTERVMGLIRHKHFTAEFALSDILRRYVHTLERLGDAYIAQRTADIFDIERRVLNKLMGERREDLSHLDEPVIVVSASLSPSQTVSLDREHILGFVTDAGGRTSHTAILARALEIPAVVGLGNISQEVTNSDVLIVDGVRGVVVVNPDEATIVHYRARQRDIHVAEVKVSDEVRGLPSITKDGREIRLQANIEFPYEVETSIHYGASGVGLYRTEFLYHSIDKPPDEEDHFSAYAEAMDHLGDRPITIRLLDLGADKFPSGRPEANPFLGLRSIRLLLNNEALLRTQLRAIFRASVYGNPLIMLPLISTLGEVLRTKEVVEDVKRELIQEGVDFNPDIPLGIMIEVPSAALIADLLAPECDFFSIGTNDLIQYTLAVDRDNANVAQLFSPADPAVLRLIRTTVKAAERCNIPVSICGEMAGEPMFLLLLIGLGLTDLSVGAKMIPELKHAVRMVDYDGLRALAENACDARTTQDNIDELTRRYQALIGETG